MNETVKKPLLEQLYYTIILFFYIYAPPLKGLPYNPAKFMLLLIVAEAMYKNLFYFKKIVIPQIVIYIILIFYTYSILIVNGTFGVDLQQGPVQQIITHLLEIIPFSVLFANVLIDRGYKIDDFIKLLISIFAVQGFIVFLEFVSYDFRKFFQGLMGVSKVAKSGQFQWFRGLGFALTRNFDYALLQSFGLFLLISKYLKSKINFIDYLAISLIFFSVIVSGRTGLVGIAFAILVFFTKIYKFDTFIYSMKRVIVAVSLIFVGYAAIGVLSPSVRNSIDNTLLPWAFEFYYNYLETGELTTASSDQLQESHYYDLSDKTLFQGDGMYYSGHALFYGLTDAGYMRLAMYFGITGILIFVILYVRLAVLSFSRLSKYDNFIVPSFVVLMLVAHYKGDVFANSLILNRTIYVIGFGLLLLQNRENEIEFQSSITEESEETNDENQINDTSDNSYLRG